MGGLEQVNFQALNFAVFTSWYNLFLGLFPPATHWLVSLIVLISIVAAFYVLIRTHWLFIILLIVLLPVIYPVLKNFIFELYSFVLYLWSIVIHGAPTAAQ